MKKGYNVKISFYISREQKEKLDYINDVTECDLSAKMRELVARYVLENEELLPEELKFKSESKDSE